MLAQIWTSKFWTFQHVKDTLLSENVDVISFLKYQFLWIFEDYCYVGARSVFLRVLKQHEYFPQYALSVHGLPPPFRLFADLVVSTLQSIGSMMR